MKSVFTFSVLCLVVFANAVVAQNYYQNPYYVPQSRVVVLREHPLVIKVYPPITAYQPGQPYPEPTYYYRPAQDAKAILMPYYPYYPSR